MTNIALIVHDSLRKDAFDEHFDWLPGIRFEQAWAPSHWTAPVHASMFTGLYPSEIGVYKRTRQFDRPDTVLTELLSDAGYTTRAFSSNANISVKYGFDRGFDDFKCTWQMMPFNHDITDINAIVSEATGPSKYISTLSEIATDNRDTWKSLQYSLKLLLDGKTNSGAQDAGAAEALRFVSNTDFGESEFLFMNLGEVHSPYDPPEDYQTTDLERNSGLRWTLSNPDVSASETRQAYDDCVQYASDIYQEMFTHLKTEFDYIITLSDHGELFDEHGVWAHDHGLYPELTHVPLTIYSGEDTTTSRDEVVSLLDVFATVLDAAGLECESRAQSLLGDVTSRQVISEYHGIPIQSKYDNLCQEFGEETLHKYDEPCRAIAAPSGYYGYEMVGGFEEIGEPPMDNPQSELAEMADEIGYADDAGDAAETDQTVLNRLENLGYA